MGWIALLIFIHFALMVFALFSASHNFGLTHASRIMVATDAARYHQIANTLGTPYRDFQVEYPPATLGIIELFGQGTIWSTAALLGVFGFAMEGLVALLLVLGWGERVALTYLALGTPLALFAFFRTDMMAVFTAVLAIFLVRRGHERSAGLSLAVGLFTKVWPAALFPLFIVRRNWKALWWFAGPSIAGLAIWVAWSGTKGPVQVVGFRGGRGWEIESLVGAVIWIVTRAQIHQQAGAVRVGSLSNVSRTIPQLVGVVVMAWAWIRSRVAEAGDDAEVKQGLASLVAVLAVMLSAALLSPQYMTWPLPWIAVVATGARDRLMIGVAAVATTLTTLMWFLPMNNLLAFQSLINARNAALVVLLAVACQRLANRRRTRLTPELARLAALKR